MANYKIWWQSTMREGGYPEYTQAVLDHAKKILSPEYEVEMHGVPNGSDNVNWLAGKYFNDKVVLQNMLSAPEQGFDAIALGCFQDPVMTEAREIFDIPVFGMTETCLQWAQMYGTHPSILSYSEQYLSKVLPRLVRAYRVEDIFVPSKPFDVSFEFMMESLIGDPTPTIELGLKAAREAIDNGADIILPGCGLLNLIFARNGVSEVPNTGVTIMDCTAVLLKVTEAGIQLREKTGLQRSNYGFFKRLSGEQVEEIKNRYDL